MGSSLQVPIAQAYSVCFTETLIISPQIYILPIDMMKNDEMIFECELITSDDIMKAV